MAKASGCAWSRQGLFLFIGTLVCASAAEGFSIYGGGRASMDLKISDGFMNHCAAPATTEKATQTKEEALADTAQRIDGLRAQLKKESDALLGLNGDAEKANAMAVMAEKEYVLEKAAMEAGTIPLTKEMLQYVEHDSGLLSLAKQRTDAEKELAAEREIADVSLEKIKEITVRVQKLDSQIVETRLKLEAEARKRMLETYANDTANKRQLVVYISVVRKTKENLVNSMNVQLAELLRRESALKEKQ